MRNKRYTLAVRRLEDGDTASSVLAVYLDREFYNGKCLTLLQAHNYAYVTPIVKWGEAIQTELSQSGAERSNTTSRRNSTVHE